ncbi:hypothetical protein HMN09_01280800 [Mycena chlorophos]|uniref:Uncharacterized protein n=1 Tax=Mycena chlorophos TaxID=658473 RepID=A0A8H6VR63_MYCCL|nr:hypothetical protein HMN09_01280800 [Mycena chlorophos]
MNANNALWGQLVRKATAVARDAPPVAPTAPLDKTGTSMRVLLHDTQSNFERFAIRVDSLSSGIEDAHREIVAVKDLFGGAQESLVNDVVGVVNRCQTRIETAVGEPSQASAMEQFRKDVEARFDTLTKRMDDMQSARRLPSRHLNALQMLTTVQEQQGQILTALLPLQPLLQAVPAHINSARSSINEAMLKMSLEYRTPPQEPSRKRSFLAPSSPRKKARIEPDLEGVQHAPMAFPPMRPMPSPSRLTRAPSLSSVFREANVPRRPLGEPVFSLKPSVAQTRAVELLPSSSRSDSPGAVPITPPPSFGNLKQQQPHASSPSPVKTRPNSPAVPIPVRALLPAVSAPKPGAAVPAPVKVSMVRGRRSPFRDGRRFIPLDDDEDSGSDT